MHQVLQEWKFGRKFLCEKPIPPLSRSLAWGWGKSLQFPSLLQKWKMGESEFLHVANLKCFSSALPGTDRACLRISLWFSGGAAGTQPGKELPTTLTPAELIAAFLPSTEPIKLLLQTGNKSNYHCGKQIPVTCSCCLNILPQLQRKVLSCQSLMEAPGLVLLLQISHTAPSSPSIFSLCRKHCTCKFYFYRHCYSPQKYNNSPSLTEVNGSY